MKGALIKGEITEMMRFTIDPQNKSAHRGYRNGSVTKAIITKYIITKHTITKHIIAKHIITKHIITKDIITKSIKLPRACSFENFTKTIFWFI